MTPKKINCVLHQIALLAKRQGKSADEFILTATYSPWVFGEEFNEAVGMKPELLEHIVPIVWNCVPHCGVEDYL